MGSFHVASETINAPPERIWEYMWDFNKSSTWMSGLTKMEPVGDGPLGEGSTFLETRKMFGKENTEEMHISKFDPPREHEIWAESCGARMSFRTTLSPADGGGTRVDMTGEVDSPKLLHKIMMPLGRRMMRKCVAKDFKQLKQQVEAGA